jgi:hypothetical protein
MRIDKICHHLYLRDTPNINKPYCTFLDNKKPAKPCDLRVYGILCILLNLCLVAIGGFEPPTPGL